MSLQKWIIKSTIYGRAQTTRHSYVSTPPRKKNSKNMVLVWRYTFRSWWIHIVGKSMGSSLIYKLKQRNSVRISRMLKVPVKVKPKDQNWEEGSFSPSRPKSYLSKSTAPRFHGVSSEEAVDWLSRLVLRVCTPYNTKWGKKCLENRNESVKFYADPSSPRR